MDTRFLSDFDIWGDHMGYVVPQCKKCYAWVKNDDMFELYEFFIAAREHYEKDCK